MTVLWPVCMQISITKGSLNLNECNSNEVFSSDVSLRSHSKIAV